MKKIFAVLVLAVFFLGSCNLFKKDPQKVVNDGLGEFSEVKKMQSNLVIKGTVRAPTGEKPEKVQFNLTVKGKSDVSEENSPKADLDFLFEGNMDTVKAAGRILFRTVEKNLYVSLSALEMPGENGEALKTQLASLFNKWWSLPVTSENSFSRLTSEQKELQEKLKNAKFLVNAREEGEDVVRGEPAMRFRVDLDKDALRIFILELASASDNQLSPEEELAIGESLKDVEFSGLVWIGSDSALHRIQGTLAIQPAQGPSSSFEFDYEGWDYGKDVAISVPEGAEPFSPLVLLPLMGAFSALPGAGEPAAPPAGAAIDEPLGSKQVK